MELEFTESELDGIGKELAEMLQLKKDNENRYKTAWGSKTSIGLAASVLRIIENYYLGINEDE